MSYYIMTFATLDLFHIKEGVSIFRNVHCEFSETIDIEIPFIRNFFELVSVLDLTDTND